MEESLCTIEIAKENDSFVVHISSDYGGNRDIKSKNFEEVLEQMAMELQEEFDTA